MQVCIGESDGREIMLKYENGSAFLDGEPLALKITQDDLAIFQEEINALPKSDNPGYMALLTACRNTFVASLLQKCANDMCVAKLTPVLEASRQALKKYMEGNS